MKENMMEQKFHISGMKCGACAFTIEKHYMRLKGIKEVSVNYGKQEIKVRYDERSLHENKLIESITPFGYTLHKQ